MDGTVTDAAPSWPEGLPAEDELMARFTKWDRTLDALWSDWRKEAREAYDIYAGRHWTKAEEEAMKEAKRPPVTINRTATVIDAVSGAEILGRQQASYFPREVGDSAVNEVLTKGAEWVRDQTDADFEESEAIRDAFITGIGWTETRMDYEEELTGKVLIERVDTLEMAAGPSPKKACLADARYLRRRKPMALDDFERLFPGKTPTRDADDMRSRSTNRRERYQDDEIEGYDEDEVIVCEWQWYEVERVHLRADPQSPGGVALVAAEEAEALRAGGIRVVPTQRRRYWRAYTAGEQLLEVDELADGEFTYKAITGKRDRNKGTWFGLMRLMKDPQRWANSFFSQILHIINTTSKGGVMAEADVVEDVRKFEESLARHDVVTWVPPQSLAMNRIVPKPTTPYPQGLDRLMEIAVTAIRDVTGVNQELLGLVEREQPGVLEETRKRAAYGVLASFFDSVRRYRRAQGRLMLKRMRDLPEGTLVRIVGDDGLARYVPLVMDPDVAKFDVIVDEAPAGPMQKERVWNTAMQLTPILEDLGTEEWGVLLDYSPFPAAIVMKLKQALQRRQEAEGQPDPMAERAKAADVAEREGKARLAGAKADKEQVEADRLRSFSAIFDPTIALSGPPLAGAV